MNAMNVPSDQLNEATLGGEMPKKRYPYMAPVLSDYGKLAEVTLAGLTTAGVTTLGLTAASLITAF